MGFHRLLISGFTGLALLFDGQSLCEWERILISHLCMVIFLLYQWGERTMPSEQPYSENISANAGS